MCGISILINKENNLASSDLVSMNSIIKYRGPDDEGFMLWSKEQHAILSGPDSNADSIRFHTLKTIDAEQQNWQVGFGHRRLSIIDLSPAGHQPMVYKRLTITYNGEVYNYIELREELLAIGHTFKTHADTEVILHAWAEWGRACLEKFNGMFAFSILDSEHNKVYLVRDRFGIKPLYYTDQHQYFAAGSEVKQLRVLPAYKFELHKEVALEYLIDGRLDHRKETFEQGIVQLLPGHVLEYNLSDTTCTVSPWYSINPKTTKGKFSNIKKNFKKHLAESVKLRMRADVPVGTCLSGGLDSSTIACLMQGVLDTEKAAQKIQTVTSCSTDAKYDEWKFADIINKHIDALPHQVFPSFQKLEEDIDKLLWHMDYPFGSTSQFSQWCVFEGAKDKNMTVMIDGQGADEQLAGYGGNDLPLYTGLFRQLKWKTLAVESIAYKSKHGSWPIGFLLGAVQSILPAPLLKIFPINYQVAKKEIPAWIKGEGKNEIKQPLYSLRSSLLDQLSGQPLPSLLRYEDRNSMAFSIESRVPFMDVHVVEYNLSIPEKWVYHKGERKYVLRESFKGIVPDTILQRRDKMGFVSAEEKWMKGEGKAWFTEKLEQALVQLPDLVDAAKFKQEWIAFQEGTRTFNFDFWRVICLGMWLEQRSTKVEKVLG
jgi:asparagine synthase (glutamine-hydrolysing)